MVANCELLVVQDREFIITDSAPFNSTEQFNNVPDKLQTKIVNGNVTREE